MHGFWGFCIVLGWISDDLGGILGVMFGGFLEALFIVFKAVLGVWGEVFK